MSRSPPSSSGSVFGFFCALVVAPFLIDRRKAGELQNLLARAEDVFLAGRVDLHGVIERVGHLAGDKAAPDQLIEPVLLLGQVVLDGLRVEPDVARANGLVRVLRALLLRKRRGAPA